MPQVNVKFDESKLKEAWDAIAQNARSDPAKFDRLQKEYEKYKDGSELISYNDKEPKKLNGDEAGQVLGKISDEFRPYIKQVIPDATDKANDQTVFTLDQFRELAGSSSGGIIGGTFKCYDAATKVLDKITDRTKRLVARFQSAVCGYRPSNGPQLAGASLIPFAGSLLKQVGQENAAYPQETIADFHTVIHDVLDGWQLKGKKLEDNDTANKGKDVDLPPEVLDDKFLDGVEAYLESYSVQEKEKQIVIDTSPEGKETRRVAETERTVTKHPLKEEFHFVRVALMKAVNSGNPPGKLTYEKFKVVCEELDKKYQDQFNDEIKRKKGPKELPARHQMVYGVKYVYAFLRIVGAYKAMVKPEGVEKTEKIPQIVQDLARGPSLSHVEVLSPHGKVDTYDITVNADFSVVAKLNDYPVNTDHLTWLFGYITSQPDKLKTYDRGYRRDILNVLKWAIRDSEN